MRANLGRPYQYTVYGFILVRILHTIRVNVISKPVRARCRVNNRSYFLFAFTRFPLPRAYGVLTPSTRVRICNIAYNSLGITVREWFRVPKVSWRRTDHRMRIGLLELSDASRVITRCRLYFVSNETYDKQAIEGLSELCSYDIGQKMFAVKVKPRRTHLQKLSALLECSY
jgi:hypothetical protein